MSQLSVNVDKDNITRLAKELTPGERAELAKQLMEAVSGTTGNSAGNKSDAADYKKEIWTVYDYGQEEFDKNILYISSSALGLTLAFIEKIVHLDKAKSILCLWWGWLLLGITILLYVLSHLISSHVQLAMIKKIDDLPEAEQSKARTNDKVIKIRKTGHKLIVAINWILYLGMASGISYIMKFLYDNLSK